jgi:pSer/pThr/pTyr-binding forkhead associated (FHA) protein
MYAINLEWTLNGNNRSESAMLDNPITLGRSVECTIPIVHETVSRHHAQIRADASAVYLKNVSTTSNILTGSTTLATNQETTLTNNAIFHLGSIAVTARIVTLAAGVVFNTPCIICGREISSTDATCPWCGGSQSTEAGFTMA